MEKEPDGTAVAINQPGLASATALSEYHLWPFQDIADARCRRPYVPVCVFTRTDGEVSPAAVQRDQVQKILQTPDLLGLPKTKEQMSSHRAAMSESRTPHAPVRAQASSSHRVGSTSTLVVYIHLHSRAVHLFERSYPRRIYLLYSGSRPSSTKFLLSLSISRTRHLIPARTMVALVVSWG